MKKDTFLRIRKALIRGIFFFSSVAFASELGTYIVKQGDTLSKIAYTHFGLPIYSKHGSLHKILSLNPSIKDKNLIVPGLKIIIFPQDLGLNQDDSKSNISNKTNGIPVSLVTASPKISVFSGAFGLTSLIAQDTSSRSTANLFSTYDFNIKACWQANWKESVSSLISIYLRALNFQAPVNSNKTLAPTNKVLPGLSFGFEKNITPKFSITAGLAGMTEVFLSSPSSSIVALDSMMIPTAQLSANYELFQKWQTIVRWHPDFSYLFSASSNGYVINSGTAFGARISMQPLKDLFHISAVEFGYRERSQITSLVELQEKTFFSNLIFRF